MSSLKKLLKSEATADR